MTLNVRLWFLAYDVLTLMHCRNAAHWCLIRAGRATSWGEGARLGEEEPF